MFTYDTNSAMPVSPGCGCVSASGDQGNCRTVDPEVYEEQCARLEQSEQAARRRAHENEYWRQRTLARQCQSQPSAPDAIDLEALACDAQPMAATDVKHRIGEMLNVFMDEYNKLKPSRVFFDWVTSMTPLTQMRMVEKVMEDRGLKGTVKPAWVRMFNRGIRYMNAGERSSYQIQIRKGLLYQNGTVFDTSTMKTRYSGSGVAVFVQGLDGTFYSSSHLWGQWQHSTSGAGTPCSSAGEWKVDKGRIQWISGKSGFYRPSMEQMINALNDLQSADALNKTTIRVYDNQNGTEADVDAGIFAANPHNYRVFNND